VLAPVSKGEEVRCPCKFRLLALSALLAKESTDMATKMSARALLVVAIAWSLAAHAPYNATVIGTTLTQFGIALQFSPETVMFDLSSQPTIVCPSGSHFVLSPTTVADAQTRKN